MKRKILMLFLVSALVLSAIPVYAAPAQFSVTVQTEQKDIKVGDTVYFSVVAQGEDVVALQFNLDIPDGMKYVSGSGAVPKGLREKLQVAAADWTEMSMIFTYYNDVGVTIPKGTVLLTFACRAESVGTHQVGLYEVLPFNSEFQEFTPSVKAAALTVSKAGQQGGDTPATSEPVDATTQPTEDSTTEPSQDVSVPDTDTQPSEITGVTDPEETQQTDPGVDIGNDTLPTEQTEQGSAIQETQASVPEDTVPGGNDTTQADEQKNDTQSGDEGQGSDLTVLWIVLGVAAVGAAVVFFLIFMKKKKSA